LKYLGYPVEVIRIVFGPASATSKTKEPLFSNRRESRLKPIPGTQCSPTGPSWEAARGVMLRPSISKNTPVSRSGRAAAWKRSA
jgi:hypothetical protein